LEENTKTKEISQMISKIGGSDISNMPAKELLKKYGNIRNRLLEGKIRIGY
jgi:hypothetical protein